MALTRDRVILLARTPFGESSLVVHGLCARHGRQAWMAKGAYRQSSRFYCVLDLFDTLEMEWQPAELSQLHTLRAGQVQQRRARISRDAQRYRAGMVVLELVDLASRAGQPEPQLFAAAERALDALAHAQLPHDQVQARFELELLELLGLPPALEHCASCAGPAAGLPQEPERCAFSASAGGRLCWACADKLRAQGRRVGTMPIRILEAALQLKLAVPPTLEASELIKVRDLIERFLGYHLDSEVRSLAVFLAAPQRNARQPA